MSTSVRKIISIILQVSLSLILLSTNNIRLTNGQQVVKVGPWSSANIVADEFSPLVTARCDRGSMYITIVSQKPFYGVAHIRDYRKAPCMVLGQGSYNTTLKISLLAQEHEELYCGVQRSKGERSVSLAVRMHHSLELSEDKFFYLTCQSSYQNIRGGTYRVNLKLVDPNTEQRAVRLTHGLPYKLRAELFPKDSVTTLRMKNCFVFTKSDDNVELIDRYGCPTETNLITPFYYNDSASAEAYIEEMFKFPQDGKVHFQCDAVLCRENCHEPDCNNAIKKQPEHELQSYSQVSASTSVWIREPSHLDDLQELNENGHLECSEWRFPWLITLCICLAIMLLVMLLLNLFMCSSLTCRCIKTEMNEKEPTDVDEYDPYRADWTAPNSLHGSRYSLQQARPDHETDSQSDYSDQSDNRQHWTSIDRNNRPQHDYEHRRRY